MVTWAAALMLVTAVALFVAAPLTEGIFRRRSAHPGEPALERLEHDRMLALQGLRELEFDHAMGKVDEADFSELRANLEARALHAMSALDRARQQDRGVKLLRVASRRVQPSSSGAGSVPRSSRISFCPQCGSAVGAGYKFCAECGASFAGPMRGAATGD